MARARKICSATGCPELQPCPHHQRKPWSTSDRRSSLPPDWPAIRARVLKRDGHRCQLKLLGCARTATEVHHLGRRDDHRLEVLVAVCARCHRTVTLADAAKARKGGVPPRCPAGEDHR